MVATVSEVNPLPEDFGVSRPGRGKRAVKIVMDTELISPFIDIKNFGVVTLSWFNALGGIIKFKGRFRKKDGTTEGTSFIGDKNGTVLTLDLAQGDATNGSSFPLDVAASFDEIAIVFPAADSNTYYISMAG